MKTGVRPLFLACVLGLFVIQPAMALDKAYTDNNGIEFVLVPSGSFMMGSDNNLEPGGNDKPPRRHVQIKKDFYLGKYEVTQEQWEKVMDTTPSYFRVKGNTYPVEQVSWEDVQDFIDKLNEKAPQGMHYRLPTEEEWEYAAQAGSDAKYSFGNDAKALGDYAWFKDNSDGATHPVGQLQPNKWGLYDMHGNVWEWVQKGGKANEASAAAELAVSSEDSGQVLKGGSWNKEADECQSAFRHICNTNYRHRDFGLRLVLVP